MSLTSLSSLSDAEEYIPRRRHIPERIDLFSKHDGEDFRIRYRISKNAVLQIRDQLDLEPMTQRNKAIDGLTQLLICLRFFATGSSQQVLRDITNIHKSTVCRIIQKVTQRLARLARVYIQMPNSEELRRVGDDFYNIQGFPCVAGALDCTHVKITSRPGLLSEQFRCSKGYLSINVQVVCDANLKIRDIIARWPGSVNGCTIFNNSHLRADFHKGKYGHYYLLGDTGYCNKKYLLAPYLQPQTYAEEAYNKSHIATHNIVERCFREWKQRCPCLEKGISLNKTSTVLQVIVASAVLHNMCLELDEMEAPSDFQPEKSSDNAVYAGQDEDMSVRTTLVNTIFS